MSNKSNAEAMLAETQFLWASHRVGMPISPISGYRSKRQAISWLLSLTPFTHIANMPCLPMAQSIAAIPTTQSPIPRKRSEGNDAFSIAKSVKNTWRHLKCPIWEVFLR